MGRIGIGIADNFLGGTPATGHSFGGCAWAGWLEDGRVSLGKMVLLLVANHRRIRTCRWSERKRGRMARSRRSNHKLFLSRFQNRDNCFPASAILAVAIGACCLAGGDIIRREQLGQERQMGGRRRRNLHHCYSSDSSAVFAIGGGMQTKRND